MKRANRSQAPQHIVDRFGDRGRARETGPLLAQPGFQRHRQGCTLFPAHPQTLFRALAVDAAFDVEQRVDALDRFERDRRDRRRVLAAPGIGRDVRELEELPPSMRPAQCGGDRPLRTRGIVQLVVAAIGVGLQDTGEAVKVARGILRVIQ